MIYQADRKLRFRRRDTLSLLMVEWGSWKNGGGKLVGRIAPLEEQLRLYFVSGSGVVLYSV